MTDSQSFADFTKLLQAKRLRTEFADTAAVLRTTAKYEETHSENAIAKRPKHERIAGETQVNAVMRNTLGTGCDAILAGEQLLAERPGRVARSRDIAAQLAEVTQSGEPSLCKFYWVPAALLLGVAMKLGKATANL